MLVFVDRNPTYAEVLRKVGVRAYKCVDDIDDVMDAVILSKVVTFLTKYRTPIFNYSKARFSRLSDFQITSMVNPIMISDLAQLCRDIGGRVPTVFRTKNKNTFRTRILDPV